MLNLCEIFTSIQGETSYVGMPCTFVRLSGCNLSCAWCDTVYARTEPGQPMNVSEIVREVTSRGIPLVSITGGEPLLQEDTPTLAAELCGAGLTVLLETNGSFDISVIAPPAIRIMDFKPPSTGESEAMDWKNLDRLRDGDEVKMILADRCDYEWAKEIISQNDIDKKVSVLLGIVQKSVLEPESDNPTARNADVITAGDLLSPAELAEWILIDKLKVRLQIQLHKILWPGIERGV